VGEYFTVYKKVVPGEEDFGHDVAVVAVKFEVVFGSQIIKAIGFGNVFVKRMGAYLRMTV